MYSVSLNKYNYVRNLLFISAPLLRVTKNKDISQHSHHHHKVTQIETLNIINCGYLRSLQKFAKLSSH